MDLLPDASLAAALAVWDVLLMAISDVSYWAVRWGCWLGILPGPRSVAPPRPADSTSSPRLRAAAPAGCGSCPPGWPCPCARVRSALFEQPDPVE